MSSAKLVPELLVSDHAASRDFDVRVIGFSVRYERLEEKFSYLDLGGAALMIEQETDFWTTAPREKPYGRGINLQIEVDAIDPILTRLQEAGIALFRPVEEAWYRSDETYSATASSWCRIRTATCCVCSRTSANRPRRQAAGSSVSNRWRKHDV